MSGLSDLFSGVAQMFGDGTDVPQVDLSNLDPGSLAQLGYVPDPTSAYSGVFNGAPSFGPGYDSSGISDNTNNVLGDIGYGGNGAPSQMSPDEMNTALQGMGYTPAQIAQMFPSGGSGGSGGSSSSNPLSGLGKSLGINNLGQLIPLLSALGMGAYGAANTKNATAQTVAAINNANSNLNTMLGNIQSSYKPYQTAGNTAMGNIQGMIGNSNLGSPNGRALSSMVK